MFVDQMPTKKVDINDTVWVEVQYLSKGYKDEEKAIISGIRLDLKNEDGDKEKAMRKMKEIENKRVVAGLKSWNSDKLINIENVKLLREDTFNKILEAIDDYNKLSVEEVKN